MAVTNLSFFFECHKPLFESHELKECPDPENSVRGGGSEIFFSHQHISQRADLPQKSMGPKGWSIASQEGSIPVFLR